MFKLFKEDSDSVLLTRRNAAIDVFRGLVMLLMVFVNDFWTVHAVPHWLEHFGTLEDGMGLSDIVFKDGTKISLIITEFISDWE